MRLKSSYIWAFFIALAVTLWMLSGQWQSTQWQSSDVASDVAGTDQAAQSNEITPKKLLTISALDVQNETIPLQVRASGVTESSFEITLINRRKAHLSKLGATEGQWVKKGDVIAQMDKGTLEADLAAAKADRQAANAAYQDAKTKFSDDGTLAAQLTAAEAELQAVKDTYQTTEKLVEKGLQTRLTLTNQLAQLRAAETRLFELQSLSEEKELSASYAALKAVDARIAALQEQLSFTVITAPQDGWLETIHAEIGEYVSDNAAIAEMIGLQKLILNVPVPQARIADISLGDVADIDIIGKGTYQGTVSKIASKANLQTRTFDVEIELDNRQAGLLAGMSAEASITIDTVKAFRISPAHLNVDDQGQLTAKIATKDNLVATASVELVRTSGNFAYISGLADGTIILAAGQAFLSEGDEVAYEITAQEEAR